MAIKKVFYRSPHNYDLDEASNEASVKSYPESLTVQSQTEDTDINVMMKRFGVGMKMPENPRPPTFGDFTGINDFATALQAITEAEDAFMEFTPEVRAKFENNPQKVMEFMENPSNYDEALRLGLVRERPKASSAAPAAASAAAGAPGTPVP